MNFQEIQHVLVSFVSLFFQSMIDKEAFLMFLAHRRSVGVFPRQTIELFFETGLKKITLISLNSFSWAS